MRNRKVHVMDTVTTTPPVMWTPERGRIVPVPKASVACIVRSVFSLTTPLMETVCRCLNVERQREPIVTGMTV